MQLHVSLTETPPTRHPLDIILALPRPKMLRRIFRTVAEFGVAHLHLIVAAFLHFLRIGWFRKTENTQISYHAPTWV